MAATRCGAHGLSAESNQPPQNWSKIYPKSIPKPSQIAIQSFQTRLGAPRGMPRAIQNGFRGAPGGRCADGGGRCHGRTRLNDHWDRGERHGARVRGRGATGRVGSPVRGGRVARVARGDRAGAGRAAACRAAGASPELGVRSCRGRAGRAREGDGRAVDHVGDAQSRGGRTGGRSPSRPSRPGAYWCT